MDDSPIPPRRRTCVRDAPFAAGERLHLVTATAFQRHALFADWRCAWAAAGYLARPRHWPQAQLLCWVLMPDHWHGLLRVGEGADLCGLVRLAKGGAAHAANLARGRPGLVWEPGFHDRPLRGEHDLLAAARHIVRSPVRAGLARRPAEYPYWDAWWLQPAATERRAGRTFDRWTAAAALR